MKLNHCLNLLLLILLINGCGQTGPLYLPSSKPPIAVSPKTETQVIKEKVSTEEQKTNIKTVQETPPDLIEEK